MEAAFEAEKQRWVEQGLDHFDSEEETVTSEDRVLPEGSEGIEAAIPGSVWKILVEEGQQVKKGENVVILESMKMEFPIAAEEDGVVTAVCVTPGEQVLAGQYVVGIKIA